MKRYVFMYNMDEYDLITDTMINKLKRAKVPHKVLNYSIYEEEICQAGQSLWVAEDYYLIAWTLINYAELLGIQFYSDDVDCSAKDGYDWLKNHNIENDIYIKYF